MQHVYDPNSQTFWGGDGTRRFPHAPVIATVPGPTGLGNIPAFGPDGTLYELVYLYVEKVDPSGNVTVLAGAGSMRAPYPPGTPAASARFGPEPEAIAVGPDGLVYVTMNAMIHRIDPVAGTIQTIAGTGQVGCDDAPVATQGTVGSADWGLAIAPDGSVYFTDGCGTLRRVAPDGSLRTVSAAHGSNGCIYPSAAWLPGQLVSTACFGSPTAVAVAADGTIYVSDSTNTSYGNEISRIDAKTGVITTYAGNLPGPRASTPLEYDGREATDMQFWGLPQGLAAGGDGTLYASDFVGVLYAIDPGRYIHVLAGAAPPTVTHEVDNGPAVESLLWQPSQVAVSPNGSVIFPLFGIPGRVISRG